MGAPPAHAPPPSPPRPPCSYRPLPPCSHRPRLPPDCEQAAFAPVLRCAHHVRPMARPCCGRLEREREDMEATLHEVASDLGRLALLYRTQGKAPHAVPLYMTALAIYEKTLGPDHPEVAKDLVNLGNGESTGAALAHTIQHPQRAAPACPPVVSHVASARPPPIRWGVSSLALTCRRVWPSFPTLWHSGAFSPSPRPLAVPHSLLRPESARGGRPSVLARSGHRPGGARR